MSKSEYQFNLRRKMNVAVAALFFFLQFPLFLIGSTNAVHAETPGESTSEVVTDQVTSPTAATLTSPEPTVEPPEPTAVPPEESPTPETPTSPLNAQPQTISTQTEKVTEQKPTVTEQQPAPTIQQQVVQPDVVTPQTLQTITAKALNDHECDSTEWHFVITQIANVELAPAQITVTWANDETETVALDKFTGKTAHYTTTKNLNSPVVSATAQIYAAWDGQFNLSHGPCEFKKPKKRGSITIIKDARPNSAQDFRFIATGEGVSNFTLDDDNDETLSNMKVFSKLKAGEFTFSEVAVSGWVLTDITCDVVTGVSVAGSTLTINLEAGANVTCKFINKKVKKPKKRGSITIIKDARPDSSQEFKFTGNLGSFTLVDDGVSVHQSRILFEELRPGTFTVTESHVKGWKLTAIVCTGGENVETNKRTAVIKLQANENVVCTFVNKKIGGRGGDETGKITIVKDVQPGTHEQDFLFTVAGNLDDEFTLDDDEDATLSSTMVLDKLKAGVFVITESTVKGWRVTDIVCNEGANVTVTGNTVTIKLKKGEAIECTFVNEQKKKVPPIVVTPVTRIVKKKVVVQPVVTVTPEAQVLGDKDQLVETGDNNYLIGLFLGLAMIGAAGALSVATRKQYN